MSDHHGYALALAEKFSYTNTYYDREPLLDITKENSESYGKYNFIISSDVFEHVPPPISRAFDECSKLLSTNGFLIVTVPHSLEQDTIEHYPEMHQYLIGELGGEYVMVNKTKADCIEIFRNLVFHSGPGATLELRLFSRKDLELKLLEAGFEEVEFLDHNVESAGIALEPWSRPFVARKQRFDLAAHELASNLETQRLLDAERAAAAQELARNLEMQRLLAVDRAAAESLLAIEDLHHKLQLIRKSKWLRLGRLLGLGPGV